METGGINKHVQNNSSEYNEQRVLAGTSVENDTPIDLTNGKETQSRSPGVSFPHNPTYLQNSENQNDVLKAARSLFSKRTRTLYHWMYPNTSKAQLKSAISLAWDTMGVQEKQFYISQVLGKFGYLQNSLMVNPQLGCMTLAPIPNLHIEQPDLSNMETRNAVSNLLEEGSVNWAPVPSSSQHISKKRGRPRGSKGSSVESAKVRKQGKPNENADDFTDDPELKKELEQFQWALHLVEK